MTPYLTRDYSSYSLLAYIPQNIYQWNPQKIQKKIILELMHKTFSNRDKSRVKDQVRIWTQCHTNTVRITCTYYTSIPCMRLRARVHIANPAYVGEISPINLIAYSFTIFFQHTFHTTPPRMLYSYITYKKNTILTLLQP